MQNHEPFRLTAHLVALGSGWEFEEQFSVLQRCFRRIDQITMSSGNQSFSMDIIHPPTTPPETVSFVSPLGLSVIHRYLLCKLSGSFWEEQEVQRRILSRESCSGGAQESSSEAPWEEVRGIPGLSQFYRREQGSSVYSCEIVFPQTKLVVNKWRISRAAFPRLVFDVEVIDLVVTFFWDGREVCRLMDVASPGVLQRWLGAWVPGRPVETFLWFGGTKFVLQRNTTWSHFRDRFWLNRAKRETLHEKSHVKIVCHWFPDVQNAFYLLYSGEATNLVRFNALDSLQGLREVLSSFSL